MIAAPRSGSGKTTVTLGLLAALRARGVRVRAAKTGPDYIDPAFHEVVTGSVSLNLDSWAMSDAVLTALLAEAADGAELLLIESAMGLFDGLMEPEGARGSPADIAQRFGIPVLLVLDVSGQGQSAAAVAHGFATLQPGVQVMGVLLNRVASDRHERMAKQAIEAAGLPVMGVVRRDAELALPERHLGLVQAREQEALPGLLADLAERIEAGVDLEKVLAGAVPLALTTDLSACVPVVPPGQRIAVAEDKAFSFLYGHLAQGWRRAGAELVPFSPLADEGPDMSCDVCWLPGGYPELHAGRLAAAEGFKKALRFFSCSRYVHGECGGFMVLGEGVIDQAGERHEMLGLLSHETSFAKRKMNLGYREATLRGDTALGQAGTVFRGHEFHYARVVEAGNDEPLADLRDGLGQDLGMAGGRRGLVSGSFFHVMAQKEGA
nr:cobyrinate a,c-diamide synthase [uncultured Neokomagataea sp.]